MNLDKPEKRSPFTDSAVALSPTGALGGQLETLISGVNHLTQSVSRFGEQLQNQFNSLTYLENRLRPILRCQNSGRESENSNKAQETKSEVSTAGDTIRVESETDALLYAVPRDEEVEEEEEDQIVVTRNLLTKLSPELKNVLSVANCETVFQLASLYELKALSDAAHDMICKNLKEIFIVKRDPLQRKKHH